MFIILLKLKVACEDGKKGQSQFSQNCCGRAHVPGQAQG